MVVFAYFLMSLKVIFISRRARGWVRGVLPSPTTGTQQERRGRTNAHEGVVDIRCQQPESNKGSHAESGSAANHKVTLVTEL